MLVFVFSSINQKVSGSLCSFFHALKVIGASTFLALTRKSFLGNESQHRKKTCPGHKSPYAKRLAYSVALSFPEGYEGVRLGGPQRWLRAEADLLGCSTAELRSSLISEWEAISSAKWLLPFAACELSKLS